MRFIDSATMALNNVRRNKVRTILTSLSIAVGAFTLTLTLGLSNGVNTIITENLSSTTEDVELRVTKTQEISVLPTAGVTEYNADDNKSSSSGITGDGPPITLLNKQDIDNLTSVPNVKEVIPDYNLQLEYITAIKDGSKKLVIDSINSSIGDNEAAYGEIPTEDNWSTNSVVLSDNYVEAFGVSNGQDLIGQKYIITYFDSSEKLVKRNVDVVGLLAPSDAFTFGLGSGGVIYSNNELMTEIYNKQFAGRSDYNEFYSATVVLNSSSDEEEVKTAITDIGDYQVSSLNDIIQSITSVVDVIKYGLIGFAAIALLAAAFGIVNTQYMSVYERTKEIGLFKAMGMSSRSVGRIFSLEATWIGIIGASLGVFLGYLIQILVNSLWGDSIEAFNGTIISINPKDALIIIAILAALSFVAGVLPALKAAKLDPIKALRDE